MVDWKEAERAVEELAQRLLDDEQWQREYRLREAIRMQAVRCFKPMVEEQKPEPMVKKKEKPPLNWSRIAYLALLCGMLVLLKLACGN